MQIWQRQFGAELLEPSHRIGRMVVDCISRAGAGTPISFPAEQLRTQKVGGYTKSLEALAQEVTFMLDNDAASAMDIEEDGAGVEFASTDGEDDEEEVFRGYESDLAEDVTELLGTGDNNHVHIQEAEESEE